MDAAALAAEIAKRWDSMTEVDSLLDAIERGDYAAARAVARDPSICPDLDGGMSTRLEILSSLALSGRSDLADEAIAIVRNEPELARARFGGGQTLLHRAAGAWSVFFAEPLLALDADPNACDRAGHPPLYYAANRFPRPDPAHDTEARSLVALFQRHGADLDRAEGVKQCTALHMAARRGHSALAESLVQLGANIEARDSNGETPLRRAVNCGQPSVARTLLAYGADPHSRCSRGRTPLDAARTAEMHAVLNNQQPMTNNHGTGR